MQITPECPELSSSTELAPRITVIFAIQALHSGGAEKQLLLIARYLAEAGFSCAIVTLGSTPRHPRIQKLVNDALAAGVELHEPNRSGSLTIQILKLAKTVRASGRSILWSWGTRADVVCKIFARLYPKVMLVCSLRSADSERIRKLRHVENLFAALVCRYVSNSWANCEQLNEVVPNVLPRCRVIYNCLAPEELSQPALQLPITPNPLRIVMLGNIRPIIKGYDYVIELAEVIRREALPILITIAGREIESDWLQTRIRDRRIGTVLEYHGEAPDPYAFLRTGHLFLLMSRIEGTPNALLEAMNLGMPCISTKVGDIARFTTDKVNIRQVEIGDVRAVIEVLKDFLCDWSLGIRIGSAARALCAKEFTAPRMAENVRSLINELVADRSLEKMQCSV